MKINYICLLIAEILILLDIIWFLIRFFKNRPSREKFTRFYIIRLTAIYLCVICLPFLTIIVDTGLTGNIIISLCAVIALEITNKDILQPLD